MSEKILTSPKLQKWREWMEAKIWRKNLELFW